MYGLSVRWSLADAPEDIAQRLRDYVVGTSLERFMGLPGLHVKIWRMRPGEEFEGCYVFASAAARDEFAERFRATMADAPGSLLVGAAPQAVEPFEVLAVAEGAEGFRAGPGPGAGAGDGRG